MIQLAGGGDGDAQSVHQAAAGGIQGGGGRLPHAAAIQKSFGDHDVSGVQAHVGGRAAEANKAMGAEAYATGNHVAFAKSPDLHTAAHEAAHVVQQRAGVSLSGGVGKSGDSHERHADAVADRVVAGKSAGDLLSQYGGGGGGAAGGVQHKKKKKNAKKKKPQPRQQQTRQPPSQGGATPTTAPTTTPAPPDDEEGGVNVSASATTAFELGLSIPIYGPVKLEGSIEGSYAVKGGSEGEETEVEAKLSGGIAIDLFIIKVTFGIEGKVKFAVEGQEGMIDAIKRGVRQIAQWRIARDFAPRLANVRGSLTSAYTSARKEFLFAQKQVIEECKANYQTAGKAWWFSKSPRELAVWHQRQWNKELQRAFSGLGAEVVPDQLIDIARLEELYDAIRQAPNKTAAIRAAHAASNFGVSQIDKSHNAAMKAVDDIQIIENDPDVGFEASVAFTAGASVQATSDIEGEFSIASVHAIQDEKGSTKWETGAEAATVVGGKVAFGGFEIELEGEFKEEEIEIGAKVTKEHTTADPEAAEHSVKSVINAVQGGGYSLLESPLATVKAVGNELGKVITEGTEELTNAEKIEERLGGEVKAGQSIDLEVKLKFKRGSVKPIGGSVALTVTALKLDAEKALGKAAAVGVSGSVSRGVTFEASWG
ncbi:MAG: DUF4157 domain-containing protein [Deltaproteobacteria bacterium]|nr:MAG: DUF4157 domain-containing protein [Deltaproteobacteria bacterium]